MTLAFGERDVRLPSAVVRFPVELRRPPRFRPDNPRTWPNVPGRLEYVDGRLLFMPPCGDIQQDVAVDVAYVLRRWSTGAPGFVVGGNEAGMLLHGEVRAADAAVWRRADAGRRTGGYRRVPPLLAVEVAGRDEGEPELRQKARWYFAQGVALVWLVLPQERSVVVLRRTGESRVDGSARLRAAELPGLDVPASDLFSQLGPLRRRRRRPQSSR